MQIDIITIFPEMFTGPFSESIVKRAIQKELVTINVHDLRQWTSDPHHTTDDRPYGGGPGMVMLVEPIDRAIKAVKQTEGHIKVVVTAASGALFTQAKAHEYKQHDQLIIIAGHYEGIDQRVVDYLADESISIGNYVLTGGELPAMVITDAITRLIPGVVGDPDSIVDESHSEEGYLEYPQYTRPEEYGGWKVPEVLLSGNHANIALWRRQQSKKQ
jgi:tRNA (guanine37-N1)-methyltransferase